MINSGKRKVKLQVERGYKKAPVSVEAGITDIVHSYATNLLKSKFCLMLHGDSSTSRRL